jgi:hypothetical protein
LKRESLHNGLIKKNYRKNMNVNEAYAAITKVARKKPPLPLISWALSTAPCEQAVYNLRLTTVATANSNCLKHERKKIKIHKQASDVSLC